MEDKNKEEQKLLILQETYIKYKKLIEIQDKNFKALKDAEDLSPPEWPYELEGESEKQPELEGEFGSPPPPPIHNQHNQHNQKKKKKRRR